MLVHNPYLLDLVRQDQESLLRQAHLEVQARAARREQRQRAYRPQRTWRFSLLKILPVVSTPH